VRPTLFLSASRNFLQQALSYKLLLAIYSYFAETEREFISIRTKQGSAAVKASGKTLGRPKGSRNKEWVLDPYKEQIRQYLALNLDLTSIMKLINPLLPHSITYNAFKYYVQYEDDLNITINIFTSE